jgi:predicted O-methyltransferase YrrM
LWWRGRSRSWTAVDRYFGDLLAPSDEKLEAAVKANRKARLPAIDVSPLQGKFLQVLVQMTQARRVLEIGLLGGYSTIWMARALPKGGRIISLEFNPRHAEVARANLHALACSAAWTFASAPPSRAFLN